MATVTYTLPIYEAVVCNLTLEKMRREESQEKLLSTVLESVGLSKDIAKFFLETDFSTVAEDTIEQTYIALCVLTDSGKRAVSGVRDDLPTIGDRYRSALATAIDDLEISIDRLEEICEAWGISYSDKSVAAQIKQALSAVSNKKNEKEIPDWRGVLGALPD